MKLVLPALVVLGLLLLIAGFAWFRSGDARGGHSLPRSAPASQPSVEPAVLVEPERQEPESAPARQELAQVPVEHVPAAKEGKAEALETDSRVHGRCVDPAGRPLAEVEVSGPDKLAVRTEADGSFTLAVSPRRVYPGTPWLRLKRSGFGMRRMGAVLHPGETTELGDIVLSVAGRISGRVVDLAGVPLSQVSVRVDGSVDVYQNSRFQGPRDTQTSAETDGRGAFLLEDVPPGSVRVWAGREGWRWSAGELLEIESGQEIRDVELVLEVLEPEDTIEFQVLDPAGVPVPRAPISYHYETRSRSGTGSSLADEHGRFRQFVDLKTSYSFLASDPDERYRPALALDVQPGVHDLVLQLGEALVLRLRAEDQQGDEVTRFRARARLTQGGFGSNQGKESESDADSGGIELAVPPATFEIAVEAEGYELVTLGPFEPMGLPAELVAHLVALPGVHGRVLAGGEPVAGAEVSLHAAIDALSRMSVNGFACCVERGSAATATTDVDGRFTLTVRESKDYFVRAEAAGFAPAEIGPYRFDARTGFEDLELALGRGGAIAGRVIVAGGEERAERIVGVSRGDGFGVTVRTDADGDFRFDGLTPGSWQVLARTDEIHSNSTSSSSSTAETPFSIPWNCLVREGETTLFDVDLRMQQTTIVSGYFRLGGKAPRGWRVSLSAEDDPGTQAATRLESDGSFRLTTGTLGSATLSLTGELGGHNVWASTALDLHTGDNTFEADVPVGRLKLRFPPTLLGEDSYLSASSSAYPRLEFAVTLEPDPSGSVTLEPFPAGIGSLNYSDPNGEYLSKAIEVPEGDTLEASLP